MDRHMEPDEIIDFIRELVRQHESGLVAHYELFEGLRKLSSKAYTEQPKKGEIDPNTGLSYR